MNFDNLDAFTYYYFIPALSEFGMVYQVRLCMPSIECFNHAFKQRIAIVFAFTMLA